MRRKKGITIGKTRRALYKANRTLGDINAVKRGTIVQRIVSRTAGRATGTMLGRLMRMLFGGRR